MKISGSPINININQVCALTEDRDDGEVEEFYIALEQARAQCKPHDINIVMEDLNFKIDRGREKDLVREYGLSERNEMGDRLMEWCRPRRQIIPNTWFQMHNIYLLTWKSPGDRCRNQIDYISLNRRFKMQG